MEWFRPFIQIFLSWVALMAIPSNHVRPITNHPAPRPVAIACYPAPVLGPAGIASGMNQFPLLPGWGHYHFEISSTNDSSRIYFDQGLSLYYGFHSSEAAASFRAAERFDNNCSICIWGQALAEGPYFNDLGYYSMPDDLPLVLQSMERKSSMASGKEKDLIQAMQQRYFIKGDNGQRKSLNRRYAEAMKNLISKYPDDLDVRALYVDAIMLEHPWNFWNNDGSPKPWTPELIPICEGILKKNPNHPGAMHYYIHLTEASKDPMRASVAANNLRISMPGVAHMVHMASHVYERTGQYEAGVDVNDHAHWDISLYDSLKRGSASNWKVPHYLEVQAFCALNGAMMKRGKPIFDECKRTAEPAKGNFDSQVMFMFPTLAWIRMGYWDSIMVSSAPPSNLTFSMILYDFAKGLACLRKKDIDQASLLCHAIDEIITDPELSTKDSLSPFSPKIFPARVARNILQAEIYSASGNLESARKQFRIAIKTEDSITYSEPKDWMLPARQYYGNCLLQWNRPAEAEIIFRDDLLWNPGNGWSITGLYMSLLAQQKNSEAASYSLMATKSFSGSEIKIKAPVF